MCFHNTKVRRYALKSITQLLCIVTSFTQFICTIFPDDLHSNIKKKAA